MIVFNPVKDISLIFLLGIINSRLVSFWFMKTFDKLQRKIFPQFKVKELSNFPIFNIDFTNPAEVKQHDRMVTLVEHMLALHKRTPQTPFEQEQLQREIAATDAQIDQLVYELYGLTDEQIRIVEGEGN